MWRRTARRQYKAEVEYFQLDPSRNSTFQVLDSIGTIRDVLTIDDLSGAYSNSFTSEVRRPDGTMMLTNAGQTTAKGVTIDF